MQPHENTTNWQIGYGSLDQKTCIYIHGATLTDCVSQDLGMASNWCLHTLWFLDRIMIACDSFFLFFCFFFLFLKKRMFVIPLLSSGVSWCKSQTILQYLHFLLTPALHCGRISSPHLLQFSNISDKRMFEIHLDQRLLKQSFETAYGASAVD